MSRDRNSIIVGIDIGSSNIRTIISQQLKGEDQLRIIGVGSIPSLGMRKGVIIDPDDVAKSINESVEMAQNMAGIKIRKAIVNIGGCDIEFQDSKGVIAIGRADGEVVEDDINRVISEAQNISLPINKEIVHIIPRKYRLDDQDNIKNPLGMKGVRLEVDALVIENSTTNIKNISKCLYQTNIEIEDVILEPLSAAKSVLSKKQKELGVVLINMGGGTTSMAVYEEGDLIHTAILPIGAGHITNDIAIGLRIPIDMAEKIKLEYGSAVTRDISKKEGIDLAQIGSNEEGIISRYHVAEIIEARLEEIFLLIKKELILIGRSELLPSGAVLVGGGAKMVHVIDLAKEKLGLPVQVGFPSGFGGILDKVDDPSFSTVLGLVLWNQEQREYKEGGLSNKLKKLDPFSSKGGETFERIKNLFEKFLP
ncbi:MAG TPA: cell division protein FtsA [Candidatus Moranbacteria bacterium]|nr:cell division protein FtsA [Candidatus Moranbacteria bacterium]HRZ33409.1 cell division protein FtsA [Candidatus Moranbacteria bacterium]